MSLPKGYKRLEYIQSSGTQYINTEFLPNQDTRIVLDVLFTNEKEGVLFGSRTSTTANNFSFLNTGALKYRADYNTAQATLSVSKSSRFVLDINKNVLSFDGENIHTFTYAAFQGTYPVYLFVLNNAGSTASMATATLYSCQIYDNGLLERDFIPCQNASGAVGLWDAANEVFYGNAGTGTFTAGPVVPEAVDESEITELEYIQSSGTQCVDSGFKPNQDTRLVMDVQLISKTTVQFLFNSRGGSSTSYNAPFGVLLKEGSVRSDYGTSLISTMEVSLTDRVIVDKNKAVCTIGEYTITNEANTFQSEYNLILFASAEGGTPGYFASMRLWSCQIYDNGLLERDFVPCKNADGEVGLYDRVYHEFYRNAGTGEFIAGPEMEHEDYTELEYIESNGAQYIKTDFYPNNNTRVLMNFAFAGAYSGNIGLCGSRTSSTLKTYCFWFYTDYITSCRFDFASNSEEGPEVKLPSGEKLALDINQNTCVCGEFSQSKTDADFQCDYDLALLGINTAGAVANLFTGQIYACQIVENGTEVRIYVPMLHPSGVAGLWDSVNERFYASATTADLIAGPYAATVPKAPSNFRVESETDTMVTLAWDASEEVLGYRLYRQGQLLADTTETSVAVAVEPFAGAVFTVTAYNENGEGAGSALTYFKAPDDPILFLITDRTAQDVTERNPKGYYAASDLNRVGYAVKYLAGRLKKSGVTVTVSPVLTWTDMDWGTPTTMKAYLADVQTMRGALKLAESTPTVPADMEKLTYTEANQIETILLALDAHIREMLLTVDAGWAMGLAYTGLYAKEAYR